MHISGTLSRSFLSEKSSTRWQQMSIQKPAIHLLGHPKVWKKKLWFCPPRRSLTAWGLMESENHWFVDSDGENDSTNGMLKYQKLHA